MNTLWGHRDRTNIQTDNGVDTKSPPPINDGTSTAPFSGLNHMVADVLASKYEFQKIYVCEHHKNDVSDSELSLFISDLHKAWNLNYLCIVYATGLTMFVTISFQ